MNEQHLKDLLAEADLNDSPRLAADLASRVRRRARTRRAVRLSSLLLIAGIFGVLLHSRALAPEHPASLALKPKPGAQDAELAAEAALHERLLGRLRLDELADLQRQAEAQAAENLVHSAAVQSEITAAMLTASGDNLLRTPGGKADAEETYRHVVQLFPNTRAALTARERINSTGNPFPASSESL